MSLPPPFGMGLRVWSMGLGLGAVSRLSSWAVVKFILEGQASGCVCLFLGVFVWGFLRFRTGRYCAIAVPCSNRT